MVTTPLVAAWSMAPQAGVVWVTVPSLLACSITILVRVSSVTLKLVAEGAIRMNLTEVAS